MELKKVVAVFGYNNTRIYDLHKIRKIARERFSAEILLVKETPAAQDLEVTPYCFDFKPESPEIAKKLSAFLNAKGLRLIGCLPFSDKGVIGAAHAARHFALIGDDCETSFAMLDKKLFRKIEKKIEIDPATYKKPFFAATRSEAKLRDFLKTKGTFFIKPTSEGNSRGCMKIETSADLNRWLLENSNALQKEIICEEVLSDTNEYSFDGVSGCYWVTKKFTTQGAFRAEYQHVIPAPLGTTEAAMIHSTLEPLLKNLGSNGGAFHHEFFLLKDGRIASVEPNRRPAGMWIWDLAAWAFENFDPWTKWLDWSVGLPAKKQTLSFQEYAGIRGVISKKNGKLQSIHKECIEAELKRRFGEGNFRLSMLKEVGNAVNSEPRDNSGFLAFIALKNKDYGTLLDDLAEAEKIVLKYLEIES